MHDHNEQSANEEEASPTAETNHSVEMTTTTTTTMLDDQQDNFAHANNLNHNNNAGANHLQTAPSSPSQVQSPQFMTSTSQFVNRNNSNSSGSLVSPTVIRPPQVQSSASPAIQANFLASIHSLHPQADLKLNRRFMLMPLNDQIRELQTVIREKETSHGNFKFYADRLIRLVVEEGLNQLPTEKVDVETPTRNVFHGIRYLKGNCGVSIVRSGESMEQGLRDCCRSIRIGKILVGSDENNQPRVLYTKFPKDIAERRILLLYPIMSTGLAVIESIKSLLNQGVKEDNLILLNLFSSPKAARIISGSFPRMFVLTSDINPVCPNHFGQRYFGTD